jgi:hypothetical protein
MSARIPPPPPPPPGASSNPIAGTPKEEPLCLCYGDLAGADRALCSPRRAAAGACRRCVSVSFA